MKPGALVLLGLLGAACAKGPAGPPPETRQSVEGLALTQAYRGRVAWKLEARSALLSEDAKLARLALPRMQFFKDGRLSSRASALTGEVRTDSHDVLLSTSVVVNSIEEGAVLETSELRYSSSRKKFLSDRDVRVVRPGGTLRGRGLEASPDLSEITIFNQSSVVDKAPL